MKTIQPVGDFAAKQILQFFVNSNHPLSKLISILSSLHIKQSEDIKCSQAETSDKS